MIFRASGTVGFGLQRFQLELQPRPTLVAQYYNFDAPTPYPSTLVSSGDSVFTPSLSLTQPFSINFNYTEFKGRASWDKTIPQNDIDDDSNGHGTHCAGTVSSRKYGVAKAVNLIAVKVLGSDGSGTMGDVVAGVLWAAEQAANKLAAAKAEYAATWKTRHKGSVANMSLGGGMSRALNNAVNRAVSSGMHFAIAASNDNKDTCSYSPAAAEKAVTVGTLTLGGDRACFSNHGECVDVFAPGEYFHSAVSSKQAYPCHFRFQHPLDLDRN